MKGDGTIYKRGNVFWMQFYRDGKQINMSCGKNTKNEEQAKTKLRLELRKSDEEFVEPRVKRTTIKDLMDNLLSHYEANGQDDYRKMALAKWATHMKPVFEHVKANTFGTDHQICYRAKRLKDGAENATINREFQILRRAFTLGLDHEPVLVKRVPKFKLTKEDNVRQGFVTTPQLEELKAAAAKESLELRVLIEAAHILGWRKSELLALCAKNIPLADNCIRIEKTKNGDPREVPLSKSLRVLIEPLVLGKKPDDRIFPFVDFRKAWARITKAAGCEGLLFHDLRRTSARSKRAAGVDTSVIMAVQGWRTDSMFRRYGIVATDDKLDAFSKQETYEKNALAEAAALAKKEADSLQIHYNQAEKKNDLEASPSKSLDS